MSTQSGSGGDDDRDRPGPPDEPGQQGGWGAAPGQQGGSPGQGQPGQQGGWGGQPGQGSPGWGGQSGQGAPGWGGQPGPGSQGGQSGQGPPGWGGQPGPGSQGGQSGQGSPAWGGQSDPGAQGGWDGQPGPGSQGGWGGQSDPGSPGWGGQSGSGSQGGWGGQSDPGAQGWGGQPGQGSQGGWADPHGGQGQTGWGGQPQPVGGYGYRQAEAPRPGPVPVRPMALGELLDAAFKLLRADFGPILLAVGAVIVPLQILTLVLTASFSTDLLAGIEQDPTAFDQNPEAVFEAFSGDFLAAIPGFALVGIVTFVLTLIAQGAVIRVGAARYLGGAEGAGDALREAGRKAGRLIGVRILIVLMAFAPFLVLVLVGALLLAAGADLIGGILLGLGFLSVFFAVYAFIRWYLVAPAIMLEDAGVRASMRRSGQLVSGNWWRMLGYLIVAGMILAIVSFAVSAVFSTLGGAFPADWFGWVFTGIGSILAALVTEPVTALISLMLYADLRVRKEGLDIQLRAAQPNPYQGGGAQFSPGASPG